VIVAGWGARDSVETVLAIAGRIKAPVLTTFRAKGIFTEDHSWVMGILGGVGSTQARAFAEESDLLITFGVGFSKLTMIPAGKPMVQVDIDPLKLGKIPFTVALWGSCGCVLQKLLVRLHEREDTATTARLATSKKEWNDQRDLEADPSAVPLRPPFIMKVLEETIPEDAVIALDIGDNMWWFGRNFRMKRQKMVMSGYLGSMGAGLPAAIAAKVAYPDKTVVCITGDGGFSQAMADFVTTVKYRLPLVVVILDNRQLAMIQVEQKMENYENFATDLLNPDFAAYAEACGGTGYRVARPEELRPARLAAIRDNRPAIVDVDTAPGRFW
jgi:pyruvate oxidase